MPWTKELRDELFMLKEEMDKIKKWHFWKLPQLLSVMHRLEWIKERAK